MTRRVPCPGSGVITPDTGWYTCPDCGVMLDAERVPDPRSSRVLLPRLPDHMRTPA